MSSQGKQRASPSRVADEPPVLDPVTPTKGKRKADEVEGNTPPKAQHRATFAPQDPRPNRQSNTSGSSYAPSSYHRKRARLSLASHAASMSAVGEDASLPPAPANAANTGSVASRASRAPSRASRHAPSISGGSAVSMPLSALVAPHAPSVSLSSSRYHMRDPRKPPRVQPTAWALAWPVPADAQRGFLARFSWHAMFAQLRGQGAGAGEESVGWTEGGGSPVHAWIFFVGFVLFPLWCIGGFLVRIPETRRLHAGESAEKGGVVLDDPQVEHDARSWRLRCRIMAGVSLLTYVPFVVLVAVFARR